MGTWFAATSFEVEAERRRELLSRRSMIVATPVVDVDCEPVCDEPRTRPSGPLGGRPRTSRGVAGVVGALTQRMA